jgi:hypothetical protein
MKANKTPTHYYGDSVRQLFFSAAAIMAALLPFVNKYVAIPLIFSIGGILILVIAAGLTKPKRSYTAVLNGGLSLLSAGLFEYYAVSSYQLFTTGEGSIFLLLFLANQILTIIFIFALYLSVKTIRGLLDKNEEEDS